MCASWKGNDNKSNEKQHARYIFLISATSPPPPPLLLGDLCMRLSPLSAYNCRQWCVADGWDMMVIYCSCLKMSVVFAVHTVRSNRGTLQYHQLI